MSDPYASHLPVLRDLAESMQMRRVLEFGAGHHSTPFFLSLPNLQRLVSVETDPAWRQEVRSEDPRHTITTQAPPVEGFDLVFIDDGHSAAERVETIRRVLSGDHPTVVIHDAEVPDYADAITQLAPVSVSLSRNYTPHTAIVWPEGKA